MKTKKEDATVSSRKNSSQESEYFDTMDDFDYLLGLEQIDPEEEKIHNAFGNVDFLFIFLGSHQWKQLCFADRFINEECKQSFTKTKPTSWWHTVFKHFNKF